MPPSPTRPCKRRPTALLPIAALLLAVGAAHAEPEAPAERPRVQFVDMAEMLIDGQTVKPLALQIDARQKVKFERLIRLDRPVLPRLRETAHDTALR